MANIKAIELKGIVHNASKIGMQDGASEDLINMRFNDGSWRPVGEPIPLGLDLSGQTYDDFYIHKNKYTNIIAYKSGERRLYWIASNKVSDFTSSLHMLEERVCILENVGEDFTITQNGNLISIVDGEGTFEYFLFKQDSDQYIQLNNDANGKQTDRELFPFGDAHINLYIPNDPIREESDQSYVVEDIDKGHVVWTHNDIGYKGGNTIEKETAINLVKEAFGKATERNLFTRPFLACIAVKLYDGTYMYATPPKLICPRHALLLGDKYTMGATVQKTPDNCVIGYGLQYGKMVGETNLDAHLGLYTLKYDNENHTVTAVMADHHYDDETIMPTLCTSIGDPFPTFPDKSEPYAFNTYVFGSDLVITLNSDILKQNKDLFTHVAIFVSPEVDVLDISENGCIANSVDLNQSYFTASPIFFKNRDKEDIENELFSSNLHLLKEYKVEELAGGSSSFLVDLHKPDDEGVLKNIILQKTLPIESQIRTTYLPKCAYSYNGRLHIANYESVQFSGYPIDCFQKDNHNVRIKEGNEDLFLGLNGVEIFGRDISIQGNSDYILFVEPSENQAEIDSYIAYAKSRGTCFAYVKTTLETIEGEQVVVRYINPFNVDSASMPQKRILDLNPIISFPDNRAKKMQIMIFNYRPDELKGIYYVKEFNLKPHKYMNLAYFAEPTLNYIDISSWNTGVIGKDSIIYDRFVDAIKPPKEKNIKEYYPNGLKVSNTDNPMYFPVENTYLIGNDGIIAMCANTIAVGIGQTGEAPLYVFCEDGIYALFVDSSGQMTYTNARAISREVCASANTVTPIDAGVVFISHRGLMNISGVDVENIGETIEGDIMQYACTNPYVLDSCICDKSFGDYYHKKDYNKIMSNAFRMKLISGLEYFHVPPEYNINQMWDRCVIGYDHINSELILSFGHYSFVLDKHGNWSRRMFPIQTFVNNFPYTLLCDNTDLYYYGKDDGDSGIYALTNIIKLDSIGFKSISRLVARGYFETSPTTKNYYASCENEWVSNTWLTIFDVNSSDNMLPTMPTKGDLIYIKTNELNCPSMSIYVTYKGGGSLQKNVNYDEPIDIFTNGDEIETIKIRLNISAEQEDVFVHTIVLEKHLDNTVVGLYVFGSYDGKKWSCLGHKEKTGKFNDIGCIVSTTDCKFFRFLLAGRVTKNTRFDYFEVTENQSRLSIKSR